MRALKYFLVILFCSCSASLSLAQVPELINNTKFRPDAKAAVDSIYNFNFKGADKVLSKWEQKYPGHPLWTLLDGMKFWWNVISDLQDTSHDEEFFKMMKKADYAANKLLYRHPQHADGLLIRAISNGYMARQYANRKEWLTSLNYARKAFKVHQRLEKIEPNMEDLKLAEGLKLYYAAYLPEKYPIVKTVSWFLPEGDKKKGLKTLKEASEKAVFARAEAIYFLGNINYNYEKDYQDAVRYFEQLQSQYPNNNYYARLLVKSYYRQNRFNDALKLINITLDRWKKKQLAHQHVLKEELLSWKGRILQRRNQQAEALHCYEESFAQSKALPNTKKRSFYAASGYWAGSLLYKQRKFDQAKIYLQEVAEFDGDSPFKKRARTLLDKMS